MSKIGQFLLLAVLTAVISISFFPLRWLNARDDVEPPEILSSSPSGTLSAGLTNVHLLVRTDEPAECRYSERQGRDFARMPGRLEARTGSTTHERFIEGLDEYLTHVYSVRCADKPGNANLTDYLVIFSFGSTISGDYTLPSTPDLTLTDADYSYISLAWSNGFDNGKISGYRLYKCAGNDCVPHAVVVASTSTVYVDKAVMREGSYAYQITSVDGVYNESPRSEIVRASSTPLALQIQDDQTQESFEGGASTEQVLASLAQTTSAFVFRRDMRMGDQGDDARELQKFLNTNGFALAASGPGSAGSETRYYGPLTAAAVASFQESRGAEILTSAGLSRGSGFFGPDTRAVVNNMLAEQGAQTSTPAQSERSQSRVRREFTPADRLRILTAQVRALQAAIEKYAEEMR